MKLLNGKALFSVLLIAGGVAAILLIGQLWFDFLAWDSFVKSIITILVVGVLSGFLVAVDYDIPASKEKYMLGLIVCLAMTMGALVIIQTWWLVLTWGTFSKIFITILILFVLVSFVLAVKEDFGTNKSLKKDNYID